MFLMFDINFIQYLISTVFNIWYWMISIFDFPFAKVRWRVAVVCGGMSASLLGLTLANANAMMMMMVMMMMPMMMMMVWTNNIPCQSQAWMMKLFHKNVRWHHICSGGRASETISESKSIGPSADLHAKKSVKLGKQLINHNRDKMWPFKVIYPIGYHLPYFPRVQHSFQMKWVKEEKERKPALTKGFIEESQLIVVEHTRTLEHLLQPLIQSQSPRRGAAGLIMIRGRQLICKLHNPSPTFVFTGFAPAE